MYFIRAAERARQAEGLPRERSKARYKKIHTKIPLCSRKHHVQKYYTLQETDFDAKCPSLPNSISEIHGVQKK